MLTAASTTADPTATRPHQSGCIEWVLACSRQEVTLANGMPTAMICELGALLERWHGSASSNIARSAAAAVAELISAGGGGRLRVSGTRSQLLVELLQPGPQALTGTAAGSQAAGTDAVGAHGNYRTSAKPRSEHVVWTSLPLPTRQHESSRTRSAVPGGARA